MSYFYIKDLSGGVVTAPTMAANTPLALLEQDSGGFQHWHMTAEGYLIMDASSPELCLSVSSDALQSGSPVFLGVKGASETLQTWGYDSEKSQIYLLEHPSYLLDNGSGGPQGPTMYVSTTSEIKWAIPLNKITVKNDSMLDPTKYTVWVAGFIQQPSGYRFLQSDGSFGLPTTGAAEFINVNDGLTLYVPNVSNMGNNRLVFTVTDINSAAPAALSPITGYTAYPFPGVPGVCPPGPYDIFEFGPNAQYDVSAVDSFGLNLSFTVAGDPLTYGPVTSVTRAQIGEAFISFMHKDPLGSKGFAQLLYTSPTGDGYPDVIADQFSAIVAPKDWLAIYPAASGLSGYWEETIKAFFTAGNQLSLYLNAATVGNYSGKCDGTKYTLTGPVTTDAPKGLKIVIPAADFSGNQGFVQAVRGINPGETPAEYAAFGQIEAAIFEAISRGVLLDGVIAAGTKIADNYTSKAWTNLANWYTNHPNAYNGLPSVYDAYAKFMHYGTTSTGIGSNNHIFGLNAANSFGMAYGFSLDENPNVGELGSWPAQDNVPSKPIYNIGAGKNVTLTIGKWLSIP
ncbi:hypothetical protein [Shewanella sp.]|uniref:hypothetical protein n=1 Tax=Shewanella sp. TaxID=50422 RepID=UPI004053875E